jgi:hypothetical protein
MYSCTIQSLKNFKLNPNWLRVGILPYWKIKNRIYLLLGIYKVSNTLFEICALSGGYKRTIETIENGAYREFKEETEEFFSKYEKQIKQDIIKSPILYSFGKNGIDRILFLLDIGKYIKNDFTVDKFKTLFKTHFKKKTNTELYCIEFVDINLFVNDFCNFSIYSDLISFMKKNNIYKNSNLENFIQKKI